jgi:hypothetical protein
MKRALLGGGVIVGLLITGAIEGQPAIAGDVGDWRDSIGALVRTEQDFFEEGQEMFEAEIERLLEPERETPILTIDDTAVFDSDAFPELEPLEPTNGPTSSPSAP